MQLTKKGIQRNLDAFLLADLIETNIRQRGIGNPNPVKLGRCIKELERIYDIHQGNGSNQYKQNPKVSDNAKTSQEQLADDLDYVEVISGEKYNQPLNMIITNEKMSTSKNILCKGSKVSNLTTNSIINYLTVDIYT